MSQMQFHSDGCIVTQKAKRYRATYVGTCSHTHIQTAEIVFTALTPELAESYAETFIHLPQMRVDTVEEIGG